MDSLRVAVCEDNPEEYEQLFLMIQDSGFPVRVSMFESGEAFLAEYHPGCYDLVLMDIYLNGISGVEAVRLIRKTDPELPVAFTTCSPDHALEGYRLDVARYMEKPITKQAVQEILKLAYEKRRNRPGIQVLNGGKNVSVPFGEILCAEQKGHYVLYHLTDGRVLRSKGKLNDVEAFFPKPPYIRCHKSYLANLAYVTGLDKELMIYQMRDGTNVHIRRESLKKAKDAWESWLFQRARKEGGML
ncbi:MAG: response regulator transcription factor [Lachnospiraceae bacterium]|jgi:Response regulator of the LytR/AlgR family|nr:response regulator transcription factor [Lachnospiraceae bacterium]MCI9657808.1 response regulator transcription factor [Lachnospiraceae bacterium]